MKKLMVLGAGKNQLSVIQEAGKMKGIRTIVIDRDIDAVGMAHGNVAEVCDISDIDKVVGIAKMWKIDAIIAPCADAGLLAMAKVNTELGLRGLSYPAAMICQHKDLFATFADREGVLHPKMITYGEDCDPLIVKPVDGVGSQGVYKVNDYLKDTEKTLSFITEACSHSKVGKAIFQQFVDGTVFNVDLLVRKGNLCYYTLHDELFNEDKLNFGVDIFAYPSTCNEKKYTILKYCFRLLDSLGIKDGNVAIEGIICKETGKIYILEVNPRMSSGRHMEVHTLATGKPWITDGINVLLGNTIDTTRRVTTPHAWAMIGSDKSGILKEITCPPFARGWFEKEVGDFVGEFNTINSSTDQTVATLYMEGTSREDAIKNVKDIANKIKIEVE